MALSRDAYTALEDLVGPENISEDLNLIDSYCRSWGEEYLIGPDFRWMPRFAAVVLPGNTKEVQAIVKVCNRWKIRFKAHSTGYGAFMCSLKEDCLSLDLRRMNRILEINEKGMYAVIEPYVIGAVLQAELMKKGLVTSMIDPGAMTSAVPIISAIGEGNIQNTYANTHRNQLAFEWVLPTGEILKTGSLGSGAGWFCSEGPGPSLRGLACGTSATMGGVGIFTKTAMKVYHWPGPPVLPVEGVSPNYRLKEEQKWFGFWFFTVPSYEKAADAAHRIGQSEIAIVLQKGMSWRIAADSARSMEEAWDNFKEVYPQIEGKNRVGGMIVMIGADTEKEFQYKEKVLRQIVKDSEGEFLPFLEDDLDAKLRFMSRWTRTSTCDRLTRRAGGARYSAFAPIDGIDRNIKIAKVSTELKKEFIRAGRIVNDGGDQGIGNFGEHGRAGHLEQLGMAHYTAEGSQAMSDYRLRSQEMMLDKGYGIVGNYSSVSGYTADGKRRQYISSHYMYNEHLWIHKIKKALDPNNVSDATFYSPE